MQRLHYGRRVQVLVREHEAHAGLSVVLRDLDVHHVGQHKLPDDAQRQRRRQQRKYQRRQHVRRGHAAVLLDGPRVRRGPQLPKRYVRVALSLTPQGRIALPPSWLARLQPI